jgi:hypothetical protein
MAISQSRLLLTGESNKNRKKKYVTPTLGNWLKIGRGRLSYPPTYSHQPSLYMSPPPLLKKKRRDMAFWHAHYRTPTTYYYYLLRSGTTTTTTITKEKEGAIMSERRAREQKQDDVVVGRSGLSSASVFSHGPLLYFFCFYFKMLNG